MTVSQLYEEAKSLPPADQFQLAEMILKGLPSQALPGYSGEWSDEDIREATAYSLSHAVVSFDEVDEDV
ncbi:MAG: hypothetical protein JO250_02200 [Armatimonadetes bacterium]|nr:hypothetical protein [Armatimonadota bacterium]